MPTGYTADVGDGKMTSFADFALNCSRAFGALVMLRDSDQSLEATRRYIEEETYLHESSYYPDEMERAQARLAELRAMTEEEALAAAQAEANRVRRQNSLYEAERTLKRERYEAMLDSVRAWNPPTADHAKFRDFMEQQLVESIRFDCSSFAMPVPEVDLDWREKQIEREVENVARCASEMAKERDRNASRKTWVTALLDSLEGVRA